VTTPAPTLGLTQQSEHVLSLMNARGPVMAKTVAEMRAETRSQGRELAGATHDVAEVRDVLIPRGDGQIAARVYRAAREPATGILVWLHGGGFAFGSIEESDGDARALAHASGFVVVSIDYRLAPEHPFPAGLEDCYAAVAWLSEHRESLAADGSALVVGGESAGGALATSVALLARDRDGPPIDFQVLVYPMTCCRPLDLPSRREFATSYYATLEAIEWLWDLYAPDPATAASPLVSPLLAERLAGLPPALVITAEHDVLRDEGERYALRLAEAGVPVTLRRYVGVLHGFMSQRGYVDEANEAIGYLARTMRSAVIGAD
jgi:acetyl esterase